MNRPTFILVAALAAPLTACHKRELPIFDGQPVTLGKSFQVRASGQYWSFPSKPGEKFTVDLRWPDGVLGIEAGSAHRDGHDLDSDDDEDVERAQARQIEPHHWSVSWQTGAKANIGFLKLQPQLVPGDAPVTVQFDREDR